MTDFENYTGTASRVALEIERKLIALGIDWHDDLKLREFAREALSFDASHIKQGDAKQAARIECYGLIGLMLKTMEESAENGYEVHGSDVWKALARALWLEKDLQGTKGPVQ
ncbi:MAG TPA: hypothetical protein VFW00_11300 [Rhodocyclaceae bacterium]|nr:hypothetical protein [Rhodocyclaceae bacterium]